MTACTEVVSLSERLVPVGMARVEGAVGRSRLKEEEGELLGQKNIVNLSRC